MKKTQLISICFSLFICFLPSQNQTDISNTLLESLVNDEHVIGAAGSYSVDGKILWEHSVGYANEDIKSPFKIDTEVRIASIAKSMTAVAVMQLVEKGQIDINLPIDHYIPEFVQKSDTKITTKHLLSHTSGIDGYKNSREAENKTNYTSLLEAYNVFKDRKLRFEPGTAFHYTSYGYVVLGILIEKVSGLSFEEYMQKHIWQKADMQHTGIEKNNSKNKKPAIYITNIEKGKSKRRTLII